MALLFDCGVVIVEGGVLVQAGPLERLQLGIVTLDGELSRGVVGMSAVLAAIDFLRVSFVSVCDLLSQVLFDL